MPVGWGILVLVLWAWSLGLGVLVLGLSRRLRLSESPPQGTRADAALPIALVGRDIRALLTPPDPAFSARGGHVLLFVSDGCPPCRHLERELLVNRGASLDKVVIVTDSDVAFRDVPTARVVVDDGGIRERLGVRGTPIGVAVDAGGVVRAVDIPTSLADVERLVGATS